MIIHYEISLDHAVKDAMDRKMIVRSLSTMNAIEYKVHHARGTLDGSPRTKRCISSISEQGPSGYSSGGSVMSASSDGITLHVPVVNVH